MTAACSLLVNPEHRGHASPGHPERPERVDAILDAIEAAGLDLPPRVAHPAPPSLIEQVHDPAYVAALDRACSRGGGFIDADTYLTRDSMGAARSAAGAVVDGIRRVSEGETRSAFAVVRPPGHHAERATARGFCLLNNVAVGVAAARELGIDRVAVLDIDVHHGNGTQHTFAGDPHLFYASTHQYPFYPGTGGLAEQAATTINVPLAAGTQDEAFLRAWTAGIGPALESFAPALLLVSAGFDAHREDPLAGLGVTTDGYAQLAAVIRGWADRFCGGRSVWALEGGYNLAAIGDSAVACLRVLTAPPGV